MMSFHRRFLREYRVWLALMALGLGPKLLKAQDNLSRQTPDLPAHQSLDERLTSRQPAALDSHYGSQDSEREKLLPPRPIQPNQDHDNTSSLEKKEHTTPIETFRLSTRTPAILPSTLTGRVEKWLGNQTPARGKAPSPASKTAMATRIYIFKGKIPSQGNPEIAFNERKDQFFTRISSDEKGHFEVQLPPGEYTIFAEINGKLFRNSFDRDGNYSTTILTDGRGASEILTDNREAFY